MLIIFYQFAPSQYGRDLFWLSISTKTHVKQQQHVTLRFHTPLMCPSTLYRLCIMRRSAKRSVVFWKATVCTSGCHSRSYGLIFNYGTITRGEVSQLADYSPTLKTSAFLFIETVLPLMQRVDFCSWSVLAASFHCFVLLPMSFNQTIRATEM